MVFKAPGGLESITVQSDGAHVRCQGKGSKERTIPIHEHAAEALAIYLNEARGLLMRHRGERALFVNRRGDRLTRQGFWLILKGYAESAEINMRLEKWLG